MELKKMLLPIACKKKLSLTPENFPVSETKSELCLGMIFILGKSKRKQDTENR